MPSIVTRGHRAVRGIVVPGVVIGEVFERLFGVARADALPTEHDQPTGGVGLQLPEIYRDAKDFAVEPVGRTRLAGARDRNGVAVDHELGAILTLDLGIAPVRRLRVFDLRYVHRQLEFVPRRLLISELGGPGDAGIGRGQFRHDVARGIVAVDSEPRRLALESAVGVAVEAGMPRRWIADLRSAKKLVRTVADAADADRRMDRRPYNHRIARRVSPTATLRHVPSPPCCPSPELFAREPGAAVSPILEADPT